MLCDAEVVFKHAKARIIGIPRYVAINRGGPYGFDTKTGVYAIADDPLKVPGCKLALVKFLDGSPVSIRYKTTDLMRIKMVPY